jgi:hypothetical protein
MQVSFCCKKLLAQAKPLSDNVITINTKVDAFCYSPLATRFRYLLLALPLSLFPMALSKINRRVKSNPDTGFGTQVGSIGDRFINRDGSFNLRKTGWPFWKRMSIYSFLLELSWSKFPAGHHRLLFLVNLFFTSIYAAGGPASAARICRNNRSGAK